MYVAPVANVRHSAISKEIQSSNDKKSFIQRACSSPSIISLYQEPFIEPPVIKFDNSICTESPNGIIPENLHITNKRSDKNNLNTNLENSNVSQTSAKNHSKPNINDKPNKYDLKSLITKLSKNDIEQLVGKISKHMSNDRKYDDEDTNMALQENRETKLDTEVTEVHEITQLDQNILSKSAMSNDVQEEKSLKHFKHKDSSIEGEIIQKNVIEHLDNDTKSSESPREYQETICGQNKAQIKVPPLYDTKVYKSSSSETPETGESSNLSSPSDSYQFWNCEIVNVTTVKNPSENDTAVMGIQSDDQSVNEEIVSSNSSFDSIEKVNGKMNRTMETSVDKFISYEESMSVEHKNIGLESKLDPNDKDRLMEQNENESLLPLTGIQECNVPSIHETFSNKNKAQSPATEDRALNELSLTDKGRVVSMDTYGTHQITSQSVKDNQSSEEPMECSDTDESITESQEQVAVIPDNVYTSSSLSNFNLVKIKRWSEYSAEWNEMNRPQKASLGHIECKLEQTEDKNGQSKMLVPTTIAEMDFSKDATPDTEPSTNTDDDMSGNLKHIAACNVDETSDIKPKHIHITDCHLKSMEQDATVEISNSEKSSAVTDTPPTTDQKMCLNIEPSYSDHRMTKTSDTDRKLEFNCQTETNKGKGEMDLPGHKEKGNLLHFASLSEDAGAFEKDTSHEHHFQKIGFIHSDDNYELDKKGYNESLCDQITQVGKSSVAIDENVNFSKHYDDMFERKVNELADESNILLKDTNRNTIDEKNFEVKNKYENRISKLNTNNDKIVVQQEEEKNNYIDLHSASSSQCSKLSEQDQQNHTYTESKKNITGEACNREIYEGNREMKLSPKVVDSNVICTTAIDAPCLNTAGTELLTSDTMDDGFVEQEHQSIEIPEPNLGLCTSPITPQITPTSGYITEDSDQNAHVSQAGPPTSPQDHCILDAYNAATPSTFNEAFESGDADSFCEETRNGRGQTASEIENSSEFINQEISSSTHLPSALSVLDISSFRIASPPFHDEEEDGINMPDLSGPSTPLVESKFHNHTIYPAPPSFPPPRLETIQSNAFEFPQSNTELVTEEFESKYEEDHCMGQASQQNIMQEVEDEKYPVLTDDNRKDEDIDTRPKDEWRSIPISIESSHSYSTQACTDSISDHGHSSIQEYDDSQLEAENLQEMDSGYREFDGILSKSKSFVVIEEMSDDISNDTSEHELYETKDARDATTTYKEEGTISDVSCAQIKLDDSKENDKQGKPFDDITQSVDAYPIQNDEQKPSTNTTKYEKDEDLSVVNTVYDIYESKNEDEDGESEEKFDTCSEASYNPSITDMDISFSGPKSPSLSDKRSRDINNLLALKARISPVIRNIPIHYGDDTIQSDMGESSESSSDSESEADDYEAMRLRRANMRKEREIAAPERDILEDDTETAEFQTRLRKLSSSSSVSQQLNCSASAIPELSRPTNASSDLIEEEEEDEEIFVDTTDEMKEISVDASLIDEQPSVKPHCPKPMHSPPSLMSSAVKRETESFMDKNSTNFCDVKVTQSEEEELDKVINSTLEFSTIKPDDERPHSVAIVSSESGTIAARFNSTYVLQENNKSEDVCQNKEMENEENENGKCLEDEEEDEFLKLR